MQIRRKFYIFVAVSCALLSSQFAAAQGFAIKSNLVADGLMNINLGIEAGLSPHWSIDLVGEYNGWALSHDRRWKHWLAQPEARYWFCERFGGHFIGVHLLGGQHNIGGFDGKLNFLGTDFRELAGSRWQGWFAGAGVAYGYAWMLGRHWNLEAEIGVGYTYSRNDRFMCSGCGRKVSENVPHHYIGPTKAAINIVYVF